MPAIAEQELKKETRAKSFYRPELDILRFIAFMGVFILHAAPRGSAILAKIGDIGGLGMCLFFVLSAFLITELLRLEKQRTGTVKMRAFYIRRILRIWPLYFTFILFNIILGFFVKDLHVQSKALVAMLLLAGNWYCSLTGNYLGGFLSPLWSISLEEQFYLLWPSFARYFSRRTFAIVSVGVIAISLAAITYLCFKQRPPTPAIWTNSFVQFQFFAMGALLALALDGKIPRIHPALRGLMFAASAFFLAYSGLLYNAMGQNPSPAPRLITAYIAAGIGSCGLLVTLLGMNLPSWTRPFVYLGKISYGLYVYHLMSLNVSFRVFGHVEGLKAQVVKTIFALGFTIGLAALSYRFLEKPFIRLKERFAVVQSRKA